MLNVSANKELTKQVEVLKKALAEKNERIDLLKARGEEFKELKTKMEEIRNSLESASITQGTNSK